VALRAASASLVLLVLVALATPSVAFERAGRTVRVSVSSTGEQADVDATPPKFIPNSKGYINAGGRYVTFEGWAPNLVAEDREGILRPHIYRHDLLTSETIRVTTRWDGKKSDQGGRGAQQSHDGRFIAFSSGSSDYFPEPDIWRGSDVYVKDMVTGELDKITVTPDGSDGHNGSTINLNSAHLGDMSSDGRYVTFSSSMTNLLESSDTNGTFRDVFLRDRNTDRTEIVSINNAGEQGDDGAGTSLVTSDGREVFFESWATNLTEKPINPDGNIYIRDRVAGITELFEPAGTGVLPDGTIMLGAISDDGRYVMFNSDATNLIPYDGNAAWDTFVHDRVTGRNERVSIRNDGGEPDLESYGWEMSSDGRFVTLNSTATNLVDGDKNLRDDAFVYDRVLRSTRRISVADDGSEGNREAYYSSVTTDGSIAAFDSTATNLVEGDTNEEKDIFVRFLGLPVGIGDLDVELSGDQLVASGWAGFAGEVAGEGSDPSGDIPDGSTDLIGAQMIVRPEIGSVQLRWDLEQLSSVAAPGVIYGMSFEADGTRWEVRGMPTIPGLPRFDIYDCTDICITTGSIFGRYGREGSTVTATIPLDRAPFTPGTELSGATFYTALGEGAIAKLSDLDSIALGDLTVSKPEISFGFAPAGSTDVTYGAPFHPEESAFSHTISLDGIDPNLYDLWVRTCLGASCSTLVRPLGDGSSEVEPLGTITTLDLAKYRGNIRALVSLKSEDGVSLEGLPVTFYLNGTQLGSVTTDLSGGAVYDIPRKDIKVGDIVEAVFTANDDYLGSSATRIVVIQDL
jgi:hypothetical protein